MPICAMKAFLKLTIPSVITLLALSITACSEARTADDIQAAADVVVGNWDIQAEGSHIRFTAKQEGTPFTGAFERFSGVIDFDRNAPETGSVRISIPLESVEAGSNDRNSTLPGKIWFSTKKFPEAIFTSTDISAAGEAYVAKGELSLKGVSVPLELPFSLDIEEGIAVMTSRLQIDRTLWNVGSSPWDTDEWVSRAVDLEIQVTASRKN